MLETGVDADRGAASEAGRTHGRTGHRPRRRPVAAVLGTAVAAVVGLAAAVPLVVGSARPARPAAVRRVLVSTLAARSVQMTFSAVVDGGGVSARLEGSGAADLADASASLHVTGTLAHQPQTASVVVDGGRIYLDVPQIARLVPGKSWVSVDTRAAGGTSLQRVSSALGQAIDPGVLLPLLESAGATVHTLGASTLGGSPVTGYEVVMDAASLRASVARAGLPGAVVGALRALTVTLYAAGGLLRELEVKTSGGPVIDVTVGFHGYGTPVAVQAPPVTSVMTFQQFLESSPGVLSAPGALS